MIELAEGPHHDWGHTPRNIALPQARGDYVVHLDDDDVCAPTALTAVRKAIQSSPGRFFVFRIVYPDGTTLWADQEVRFGNLGTALFVHPTGILLAHFGPTHGGDYEFVSQTIRLNPERQVKWQPEVITLIQPHQTWSNPQFVDLAQQTGDEGRYDCQKGWQEFVGRYFKNKTILDVGAGLGQSRERLAHGGNHVVLQDPAPGMPVDYTQPIFEMESQGWDVITCFDVLEHIAEPVPFLEQLLRLARTTLVITTPNYWVSRCGNPFHVREYTPPQLIQQLEQLPRVKAIQCFTSAHEDGSFPCPRTVEEFVRSEAPRLAVFLELAPIKDQERSISGVDASATSAVLSRRSLEHLTPCECTEPGWCERHQCEKSMFMQEMCRRSTEWYELWESRDGPGQTATKAMEFSRTQPCQHLGPLKNTVQCPSCFGNVQIKVFACNLREECTRSRKIDRVASCLSCSDYIAY